jgi:hypothetical protein
VAGPVEAKVTASTAAAAVSGLALWSLGHYVFKAGVPDVVASWTYVLVPGALTFAAGYAARHTPRPPAWLPPRPAKTLAPRAAARGTDISPLADPPMEDLPAPLIPPAAPPE